MNHLNEKVIQKPRYVKMGSQVPRGSGLGLRSYFRSWQIRSGVDQKDSTKNKEQSEILATHEGHAIIP
jgi:hypothetical protein